MQIGCKRGGVTYLDGGGVQSHRPEFQWPHVRTIYIITSALYNLSTPPPYICVSVVNLTPCPPQEPDPLRFAVRLRVPQPMLPSPALG